MALSADQIALLRLLKKGPMTVRDVEKSRLGSIPWFKAWLQKVQPKKDRPFTEQDVIGAEPAAPDTNEFLDELLAIAQAKDIRWTSDQSLFDDGNRVFALAISDSEIEFLVNRFGPAVERFLREYTQKAAASDHTAIPGRIILAWVRYTDLGDTLWVHEVQTDLVWVLGSRHVQKEDVQHAMTLGGPRDKEPNVYMREVIKQRATDEDRLLEGIELEALKRFVHLHQDRKIVFPTPKYRMDEYPADIWGDKAAPASIYNDIPKKLRFSKTKVSDLGLEAPEGEVWIHASVSGSVLTANTKKRLDFVLSKMKHAQDMLVWIVMNAIGLEQYATLRNSITGTFWSIRGSSKRKSTLEEVLKELGTKLDTNAIIDPYVPWLATRLNKLEPRDVWPAGDQLVRAFRSIAIWASETKTDLNKLSLQEALDQSADYVPNAARKGKQDSDANPVVYRFADGHKVVELKTPEALKREGDVMKHCVGDYCEAVEEGESVIYSLRDPSGKSLITMELNPRTKLFEQIFGPSNRDPNENEKRLVLEFIEQKFPNDKISLMKMGKELTDQDWIEMARSPNARTREQVARLSPSAAALDIVADDAQLTHIRVSVAARKEASPATLLKLAGDSYATVRKYVAINPKTPKEALELLAEDESWEVQAQVAGNTNTPPHTLEKLSDHPLWNTKTIVARNPNTPTSVLEKLSANESPGVRAGVARNPSTPLSLLMKLSNDKDILVQKALYSNLNWMEHELSSSVHEVPASNDIHMRIAKALGWTIHEVHTTSLASLRELLRPVDKGLYEEVSKIISSGRHIRARLLDRARELEEAADRLAEVT